LELYEEDTLPPDIADLTRTQIRLLHALLSPTASLDAEQREQLASELSRLMDRYGSADRPWPRLSMSTRGQAQWGLTGLLRGCGYPHPFTSPCAGEDHAARGITECSPSRSLPSVPGSPSPLCWRASDAATHTVPVHQLPCLVRLKRGARVTDKLL
jgi:hypothetical protein